MVYFNLNRLDLLEHCDQEYRSNQGGYRRAWEIVNDIEGYEAVIDDLKNHFAQQVQKQLQAQGIWSEVCRYVYTMKDILIKTVW